MQEGRESFLAMLPSDRKERTHVWRKRFGSLWPIV